jgi:hypothetical protein
MQSGVVQLIDASRLRRGSRWGAPATTLGEHEDTTCVATLCKSSSAIDAALLSMGIAPMKRFAAPTRKFCSSSLAVWGG